MSAPRTVYYDHGQAADTQPMFPRGEAGPVILDAGAEWVAEPEVWIGPNSHCALVHHGVVEELNALPRADGSVGSGRDSLLPPGSTEAVARIFYEADRKTYGASHDFLAFARDVPQPVHYRIAIDNREYQKTLSQLQFLSTTAARHGHGLRLRL